ncbi:hypothetical protein [Flammeovirga agarivorans]|uniref:Uncharacterized protein n=1 Tax=Flammeovirga agarivorans TaxID=2726742 RepID=A0A7X8XY22_9BACT|nr:hypothetical protein [Flammeovirga agarivorans]NLR93693.1 hypothetical protein [Flammeovirga agarivorans]
MIKQLFSILCISILFFNASCTTQKEVVEELEEEQEQNEEDLETEFDLPTLVSDSTLSFLRGDDTLSASIQDLDLEYLEITTVVLEHNNQQISEGIFSEDSTSINFPIDSKELPEGFVNLEVKLFLKEVLSEEEVEVTTTISMEVDNYFPAIFYESNYIQLQYFSYTDVWTAFSIDLFYADLEYNRITDIYNVANIEGDSLTLEIPEGYEGQEYFLCKLINNTQENPSSNGSTVTSVINSMYIDEISSNGSSKINYASSSNKGDYKSVTVAINNSIDYSFSGRYGKYETTTKDGYQFTTFENIIDPTAIKRVTLNDLVISSGDNSNIVVLSYINNGDTLWVEEDQLTEPTDWKALPYKDRERLLVSCFVKSDGIVGQIYNMFDFYDENNIEYYKTRKVLNENTEVIYSLRADNNQTEYYSLLTTTTKELPFTNYRNFYSPEDFGISIQDGDVTINNHNADYFYKFVMVKELDQSNPNFRQAIYITLNKSNHLTREFNFNLSSLNQENTNTLFDNLPLNYEVNVTNYDDSYYDALNNGAFKVNWDLE